MCRPVAQCWHSVCRCVPMLGETPRVRLPKRKGCQELSPSCVEPSPTVIHEPLMRVQLNSGNMVHAMQMWLVCARSLFVPSCSGVMGRLSVYMFGRPLSVYYVW
mmetsp:Transcript_42320/g.123913  ORF Transcript_42320/g.123913 Transcript_42320/m.123913 type:complete len:104 (+) Transcript_42320:401-712(+)